MRSNIVLAATLALLVTAPPETAPATGTRFTQSTQEQIEGLNHFVCYQYQPRFKRGFKGPQVGLKDQFTQRTAKVRKPRLHCNPVRKRHGGAVTPIARKLDHLTVYGTSPAESQPERIVGILNQFGGGPVGEQYLHLGQPTSLAVPSLKASGEKRPPPKKRLAKLKTDHFQCWDVTNFNEELNPAGVKVRLRDQTGVSVTRIKKPTTLCNPVEKTHAGKVTPIQSPEAHLVCYATGKMKFKQVFERQFDWKVRNQLGKHALIWPRNKVPRPAFRLCVPSVKVVLGFE